MLNGTFDDNILDDSTEMFLVDQAADEQVDATWDLIFNLAEFDSFDALLDDTTDKLGTYYVAEKDLPDDDQ